MNDILRKIISERVNLTEDQLVDVLASFKLRSVKKHERLLEKGQISNKLYFIEKGCLRLYYAKNDTTEATRFMAFENTFLTSLVSFISRQPSLEYIQAVEKSEVLGISHHDFFRLQEKIPVWEKFYIYILEYGITVITNRLNSLLTKTATDRYLSLLRNNPELVQRLSNSNLAAYLNVSPETLSRLKSYI